MASGAEQAIAHYLGKGLTKDVAVGIVSVLNVESGLNPLSENNSGTENGGVLNPKGSYGLAQWNGPRQQSLLDFANHKGISPADLGTQLDFILTECANSYPVVWKAIQSPATTYAEMISTFVDSFEIPANKPAEIDKAMAYAKEFYALVVDPTVPVAPTPQPPSPPASAKINVQLDPSVAAALMQALTSAILKQT